MTIEDTIRKIVREEMAALMPKKSLRELRKDAGMDHKTLSAASNVGTATISRIERGKIQPRRRTVERLAKALKVKAEQIGN